MPARHKCRNYRNITSHISMALIVTNQAKDYQFNNKPDENVLSKQKSERRLIEYPDSRISS